MQSVRNPIQKRLTHWPEVRFIQITSLRSSLTPIDTTRPDKSAKLIWRLSRNTFLLLVLRTLQHVLLRG